MSDLRGAWGNLRSAVVEHPPFPGSDRLLFHINEAMSWENVRNLDGMKSALLLILNIAAQGHAPEEVQSRVEDVKVTLDEVFAEIAEGKVV